MRHAIPVLSGAVLAALLTLSPVPCRAQEGPVPDTPPPREIPGITTADRFPGGCVDCHVEYPEQDLDVRLSTLVDGWTREVSPALLELSRATSRPGAVLEGRHPEVQPDALANIPGSCIACHARRAGTAPDMARLVHRVHLGGGGESVFLTVFQGECTHCHKLDLERGAWTVPSGREGAGGG